MEKADFDPATLKEYLAILDARGLNPEHFHIVASAASSLEGELGPSSRTVSVTHKPTGTTKTYSFRTWLADLKADIIACVSARQPQ